MCGFFSEWLYPSGQNTGEDIRQQDGQHEMFSEVERAVRQKVAEMLNQRNSMAPGKGESLLAGALARALCYVHR